MNNKLSASICFLLLASGCANTPSVQPVNPMDRHLTCDQLQVEVDSINSVIKSARADKGATGANVAASLFFWPAALGTNYQASGTLKDAYYRRDHLTALMLDKKCKN